MIDTSLPTGPELVARLVDLGLAPVGVTREGFDPFDAADWEPWKRIDHCWYLVERFGLSINYAPMPYRTFRQPWWWVAAYGIEDVRVATFTEVPAAICWAAILVQEGRAG